MHLLALGKNANKHLAFKTDFFSSAINNLVKQSKMLMAENIFPVSCF